MARGRLFLSFVLRLCIDVTSAGNYVFLASTLFCLFARPRGGGSIVYTEGLDVLDSLEFILFSTAEKGFDHLY